MFKRISKFENNYNVGNWSILLFWKAFNFLFSCYPYVNFYLKVKINSQSIKVLPVLKRAPWIIRFFIREVCDSRYSWELLIPLCHLDMCWKEDLCFMLHFIFWTSRYNRSDNLTLARNDRLAELDEHYTSNLVMVGVVSSIPTGGNFIFSWNCQYCTEM